MYINVYIYMIVRDYTMYYNVTIANSNGIVIASHVVSIVQSRNRMTSTIT